MSDNLRGRDMVYTDYTKPTKPIITAEEMERQKSSLKKYNLKDLESSTDKGESR